MIGEIEKQLLSIKINEIINNLPKNFFTKNFINKLFGFPDNVIIPLMLYEHVETFSNYLGFIKYMADCENFPVS